MGCPYCTSPDSKVTDSRSVGSGVRRRRECLRCGLRFTTYERLQTSVLLVVKRDGVRQEFDRDKLMSRIITACAKRPIPIREIDKVASDIENDLQALAKAEVSSSVIGEMVMEKLRLLDRVAYVRWASVYRDFQDLESFERVVRDLKDEKNQTVNSAQLSLLGVEFPDHMPAKHRPRRRARLSR